MTADEEPRVVLIGPVRPFRSGIAEHTTRLAVALERRADLLTLSFSRQYPGWLFPGARDHDPALGRCTAGEVDYLLDTLDPRTWEATARAALAHRPETVIIPWWTVFFVPCFGYLAARLRGGGRELVFMCHNVADHEDLWWKRLLTSPVLRLADRLVVQSQDQLAQARVQAPRAQVEVCPHPLPDTLPRPLGVKPRRAAVEVLFFGIQRPYKGLDTLLAAMARLQRRDVFLTIAGESWGLAEELQAQARALGVASRVELMPHYVGDAEAAELFHRADVVVLPYRSVTGSGVVATAYHYGTPVIATRVGGFPEVVDDGETGLLVSPDRPDELAAAIASMTPARARAMAPAIARRAATMTFTHLVEMLLSRRSAPPPSAPRPDR